MTEVTKLTKKNKNVLLTIVGIAIIAGGLFYWFQIRPSTIRSSCADTAVTKAKNIVKTRSSLKLYDSDLKATAERNLYYDRDYQTYYKRCLQEKGLK